MAEEKVKKTAKAKSKEKTGKKAAKKASESQIKEISKSKEKTVKKIVKSTSKARAKPKSAGEIEAAKTSPETRIAPETPEIKEPPAEEPARIEPDVQIAPDVTEVKEIRVEEIRVDKAPEKASEPQPTVETPKPKEPDQSKEFVDSIMAEMNLKGAGKRRLVKMLAIKYNFDRQKVMFKLKRALITERYAAAHAEM